MKPHRLTMASAVIAGLASLGYTMAYIGRWEWQRAQLAADLTLLCAILVLGLVIDSRTRNLPGRRTDTRADSPPPPPPTTPHPFPRTGARVTPLRPAPTTRPRPAVTPGAFAWLDSRPDPRTERYGVFIPILLGAGMAASGMAWALERVSGVFSGRAASGTGRKRAARPRPDLPDTLLLPAETRLADVLVGYDTADPAELWLRGPIVAPAPRDRDGEKQP